jgi:RNA polymerase sigma factor (sigma-70 family)
MKHGKQPPINRRRGMLAVVLGTALAALGPSARGAEAPPRAVDDISRYCTACWRNARLPSDRWGDCTQEVFCRLLQRVPPPSWPRVFAPEGDERQEFLRAIDTVKKRAQRERHHPSGPIESAADRRESKAQNGWEISEALHHAVRQCLTRRQQRIVQLTLDGWDVSEIAGELGISPARVSDEKYKAIQKLRGNMQSWDV